MTTTFAAALRWVASRWWRLRRRLAGPADRLAADNAVTEFVRELRAAKIAPIERRLTADGFVRVRAAVTSETEDAYREICARIYRAFPELPIERLFCEVWPLEPLDRIWARDHAIPEHAHFAETSPCIHCHETTPIRWVFGRKELRQQRQMSRTRVRIYADPNGGRVRLRGHLCEACLKKSRFILIVGRPDDLEDA